jgi:hypothetical protein
VDGETPEEKPAGRVRAYRRGREKEGGRYGVIRGTDQKIDTNNIKENERLHKEAEDEEPMELRRKTS